MLFSSRGKIKWYLRALAAFLLFFLFTVLLITKSQYVFESALNSLFITFDDFEPSYSKALATAGREPFDFDFPPVDVHPSSTIPPVIHFIWFPDLYDVRPDATPIAHEGSNAPTLCIENNPEFKVNVWNASGARALLENDYPWFLPTYDGYKHPIQRVDAIKYFILNHYGGIYLDLDVSCRKALRPLLDFPAWFPRASPLGVNNDIMASRPGHPLMWYMIDNLKRRDKNLLFPWVTVFWTTGPKYTSDILQTFIHGHGIHGANNAKERIRKNSDANAVYVLPREFYSEDYTFFGHRAGGTWHGQDVAVILWLVDRYYLVLLIAAFAVVIIYLSLRSKRRIGNTKHRSLHQHNDDNEMQRIE